MLRWRSKSWRFRRSLSRSLSEDERCSRSRSFRFLRSELSSSPPLVLDELEATNVLVDVLLRPLSFSFSLPFSLSLPFSSLRFDSFSPFPAAAPVLSLTALTLAPIDTSKSDGTGIGVAVSSSLVVWLIHRETRFWDAM